MTLDCTCNRLAEAERKAALWDGIVRCRECEYMHTVRSWLGMDVDECWLHADHESGALGKKPTQFNGFCCWGERRRGA